MNPRFEFCFQGDRTVAINGESVVEFGHSFVSANKGTQWGLNADQGAGANAGSVDEMVFVVNSSPSELVWSPSKGLRVKCADCSVVDKNSLFWSSESGNMIIQPSQSLKGEEIENDGIVNEENLCSVQLAPNSENAIYITKTLLGSPRCHVGIMPGCQEESSRSCGIKDPMITALPNAEVDSNRVDKSAKEGMDMCSHSDTQENGDINKKGTVGIATLDENASIQDQDNTRSANSSTNGLEETRPDLAPVEPEIVDLTTRVSSDEKGGVCGGDNQAAGSADTLVSKASKIELYDIPKRFLSVQSLELKHAERVSVFEGNSGNEIFNLEKGESIDENDVRPLKIGDKLCCGSPHAEVGTTVTLQPEVAGHFPENKAMLIEASLNERGNSLKRRKGKEKIFSDTELNLIISKEDDGSHESIESCNSGQLFSKGKRAGKFEHQLAVENKRIKRLQSETPCSASFIGKDSSFMNWISNVTKGLSKLDSDVTPLLALPAGPSHQQHESHDTLVVSHDKIQDPVGNRTGFLNVFQTLYCPREVSQNKVKCILDQQTEAAEEGSKELQVANKMQYDNSSFLSSSNEENSKLQKHAHVGTSTLPNVCSAGDSSAEEKTINVCNIASESKIGEDSSDSYFKKKSGSHEEKGALIHGSIEPNKFSNSFASRSPLESLWITRFSPKVCTPTLNSVECHQDKGGTTEGFTDCNKLHPLHHNLILSIKDKYNLEDGREPSIKDQINAVSRTVQYCPVSPTGSCGSVRAVQADQKFKPNLNPILPSQGFKSSEAMASVFARRLDALKHISPSKVTDDASPAAILCFYCGKRGHLLRDCSEIIESEVKDLHKEGNMYYGFEEASCLCIRCFQFNHWAVACPYSSTRKQTCQNDNASCPGGVNSERNQDTPEDQNPLVDTCIVNLRENSRDNNKSMACANKINGTMILDGRYSDYRPVKRGLPEEDCHTGMSSKRTSQELVLNREDAALSSQVNELKENQIMPYCSKQISSIPREVFEIIRRLRLSRSDILKWMNSPNFNFCLEGFFLRLRLGKWEEGLGGTGYHVACISGASRESSGGSSKLPISVDIGGLKCAVDCRNVSNHDFNEDELKAWSCANLRGPRKLPRIEELNIKLAEKEKYGF